MDEYIYLFIFLTLLTDESADNTLLALHRDNEYAKKQTMMKPLNLSCPNCEYVAKKMSVLKTHIKEHCPNRIVSTNKNIACPVCEKYYTYNSLRRHLNGYIGGKHTPRGKHANIDKSVLKKCLGDLKKKKQI